MHHGRIARVQRRECTLVAARGGPDQLLELAHLPRNTTREPPNLLAGLVSVGNYVKARGRRILRLVRRPILVLALVIAASSCRCNKRVVPEALPTVAPDLSATPAAAAPEPTEAPSAPPPDDVRTQPPTPDEISVQLRPLLPAIKACIRSAGPIDMALALELHVRVEPAGEVSDAAMVPLPNAHDCIKAAVSSLRLPMWRGSATLISLPMNAAGEVAVPRPPDGGQ